MLTPEFDELYGRLVSAFRSYHDVARSAEDVAELARRRTILDSARGAIAGERDFMAAVSMTDEDAAWLDHIGAKLD